jgi:shikimate kinase
MSSSSTAQPHINTSTHIRVFLIGMMGTGKTYWAEKLKKKLKVPAYDLDNLVETMNEKTIAEIFEEDGEDWFRKEEAKMLRLFKEKKHFILSCGGGTPCFNDNMQWMNKHGITIWIDEPINVLTERLIGEKEHRPLIKKLVKGELAPFLANKLEERRPFYLQSTYRLNGENISEKSLINIIKEHA